MAKSRLPQLRPRLRAPSGYSPVYERKVTLSDGRIAHLRPIVPDDLGALRDAVAEADAETLRHRFLGGRPPKTDEEFQHLVEVDYNRRFAVVALSTSRRGIGLARYDADEGSTRADVAVAVDAGWRRVGLATALLRGLAEAALDNGVERFTIEFLGDNLDVASIIRESHLPIVVRATDGVTEAEVDIGAGERDYGLSLPPSQR